MYPLLRNTFLFASIILVWGCAPESPDSPAMQGDAEAYEEMLSDSESYREYAAALDDLEAAESEDMLYLENYSPSAAPSDEPFVFFVIGDSELRMRGNTYPQLEHWILKINDIDSYGLEFAAGEFEAGESRAITKPELVFLAGDINKDRAFGFSLPGDENDLANRETRRLFNQLDDDILFLAGNGNHDWDPYRYGDGSYGHNLGGLLSNLGTAQFVRSSYLSSLNASSHISDASFNYERNAGWFQPTTSAEFNYSLVYKGVRFTQLNQFLYVPAAMVSLESLFSAGPAWYFATRTDQWFAGLCNLSASAQQPHVVVQHFPVRTGDGWWNDNLGGTPDALRKGFMDIFSTSHGPVMFSGHNHINQTTTVQPYGIKDHTCGYFPDGYITAVKASATRGIYAVSYVNLDALTVSDPAGFGNTFSIPQ